MNILPSIYRGFTPFIENSFLSPLNRPERKISMLALGIIFGSLAALAAGCALYFMCFRRKARVIKNDEQPKVASSSGVMRPQSPMAVTSASGARRPSAESPSSSSSSLPQPILHMSLPPPNSSLTSSQILPQPIIGVGSTPRTSELSSHQNGSADVDSKEEMNGNGVGDKANDHQEADDSKTNGSVAIVNGTAVHGAGDIHETKEASSTEIEVDEEDLAPPMPVPASLLSTTLAETESRYIEGIVKFVFEWFGRVARRRSPNNDLISPLGLSQLLSIIRTGAKVEKRFKIDEFTKLPRDAYNILKKVSEIIKKLKNSGLRILNLIYLNKKYNCESYIKRVAGYQAQAVCETIEANSFRRVNSIIARATDNFIPGSIGKHEISQLGFNFLLLNAMHLSARWANPFEVANSKLEDFRTSFGTKKVKMMYKTGEFGYFREKDYQAIQLPYGGDKSNFSLLIVLPDAFNFEIMNAQKFNHILANLRKTNVSFAMPHFAFRHRIDLTPEIGIARGGIELDFSEMRDPTTVKKALSSSSSLGETWGPNSISQELSFSCDEEGSEVLPLASGHVGGKTNGYPTPVATLTEEVKDGGSGKSENMHCNHPFIAIVVEKTGLPVLLTLVKDPTQPDKIGSDPRA